MSEAPDMDEEAFTPLDPRFRRLLRIRAAIRSAVVLALAAGAERVLELGALVLVVPALLYGVLAIAILPARHYASRGYRLDGDGLRTVRGVWNHVDITVPLGRIQHIDVRQAPLERANGLATLILHTAGTDNGSVSLEGLAHEEVLGLRDQLRTGLRKVME